MKRLFNKTFFKFVGGFVGVVAVALLGVFVLGAYEMGTEPVVDSEKLITD